MSYVLVDPRFPEAPEVSQLTDREFWDEIERALRYAKTRAEEDLPRFPYWFKFRSGDNNRHKHWDRAKLWEQFDGVCYLCREPVPLEAFQIEHVVPLARGGADAWDNLNVAHQHCNARKGTKLLEELEWYVAS